MAFLCFMPGSGLPVPPAAGSPFGIRGVDSARGSTPLTKPETGADPRRFGKERLYL